jgi:hypothetical protein
MPLSTSIANYRSKENTQIKRQGTPAIGISPHYKKTRSLKQTASNVHWTPNETMTYETIDKIASESMQCAEKKSCQKYTKLFDWSPPLVHASQAVQYWRLLLKRSEGKVMSQHILEVTGTVAGLSLIVSPQYKFQTRVFGNL